MVGLGLGLGWRGRSRLSYNHTSLQALSGYTQCVLAKTIVPPPRPLSCRRYKLTKNELKGCKQCEAVSAVRPSSKSLSTELWILLASWHVTLRRFVASTMRTWLLPTCALALAPFCSGVPLPGMRWSASISTIDFHHFCVSSPMAPVVSKTRGPFVKGRPWSPVSSSALLCPQLDHVPNSCCHEWLPVAPSI